MTKLTMSENCIGNFSTSNGFLLKLLDFASDISQSNNKCDRKLTENHVDAGSNPAWSGTSRTSKVGAVTRIRAPWLQEVSLLERLSSVQALLLAGQGIMFTL